MNEAEGGPTRRTITGMLWAAWRKGAHAGLQLLVVLGAWIGQRPARATEPPVYQHATIGQAS